MTDVKTIFTTNFPTHTILHESPEHYRIIVPINELLSATIIPWKHSKPADMLYCRDLAEYYMVHPMDAILYINVVDGHMEVYEDIHYLIALRLVAQQMPTKLRIIMDVRVEATTEMMMPTTTNRCC